MDSGIVSLRVGKADPSLRRDIQSEKSATKSEFGVWTENGGDRNMAGLSKRWLLRLFLWWMKKKSSLSQKFRWGVFLEPEHCILRVERPQIQEILRKKWIIKKESIEWYRQGMLPCACKNCFFYLGEKEKERHREEQRHWLLLKTGSGRSLCKSWKTRWLDREV